MKGHGRIALTLAALAVANLVLDAALVYYGTENALAGSTARRRPPIQVGPQLARSAQLGTFVGQVVLIGFWLALGDAAWYWRVFGATLLTGAASASNCVGFAIGSLPLPGGSPIWTIFEFRFCVFLAVILSVFLVAAPFRELRGWRLTRRPAALLPVPRHLHIADLMLWMVPFGCLLAVVRLLASHGPELGPYPGRFVLRLIGVTVIAAVTMLNHFAPPMNRVSIISRFLPVLVLVGLLVAEIYWARDLMRLQRLGAAPLPPGPAAGFECGPIGIMMSYYAAITFVILLNSIVMRRLGCRLIGPRDKATSGLNPPAQGTGLNLAAT